MGAQAAQQQFLATFRNTATPAELAAFTDVQGTKEDATVLPAAFPSSMQTPAEYYIDYERESRAMDKAIDAVEAVINETANDNASTALREVRIYGGLAAFAMAFSSVSVVGNSLRLRGKKV